MALSPYTFTRFRDYSAAFRVMRRVMADYYLKKKTRDPNNIHSTVVFDNNKKTEKKRTARRGGRQKTKRKWRLICTLICIMVKTRTSLLSIKKKVKTKEKKTTRGTDFFFWLKFTFRPYFPHQSTPKKKKKIPPLCRRASLMKLFTLVIRALTTE